MNFIVKRRQHKSNSIILQKGDNMKESMIKISDLNKILESYLLLALVAIVLYCTYSAVVYDKSFVEIYFIFTAMCYFVVAKTTSPGSLVDYEDSGVKGICYKCGRIRGRNTKHCEICEKCYCKKIYHCPVLGKCVAKENLKEYLYFLLFSDFYFIWASYYKKRKFLLFCIISLLTSLIGYLISKLLKNLKEKNEEGLKKKESGDMNKLFDFLYSPIVELLLPLTKMKTELSDE